MRSQVHLAKLEVQTAIKAQKSSNTTMADDEICALVNKAIANAKPFYLSKGSKGKDDSKKRKPETPSDERDRRHKSASKFPHRTPADDTPDQKPFDFPKVNALNSGWQSIQNVRS